MLIEKIYNEHCETESDINEHLPTLKKYTEECDSVIEMGVRTVVSTWAFLAGNPKSLVSIDIQHPEAFGGSLDSVYEAVEDTDIDFSFRQESTLTNEIEECDFLFIDTLHTYEQLIQELRRHGNKARKYLAFHDTQTFGTISEHGGRGLNLAIAEFMQDNPHWVTEKVYTNNNGLTILRRELV
jgi:hypothetical protein